MYFLQSFQQDKYNNKKLEGANLSEHHLQYSECRIYRDLSLLMNYRKKKGIWSSTIYFASILITPLMAQTGSGMKKTYSHKFIPKWLDTSPILQLHSYFLILFHNHRYKTVGKSVLWSSIRISTAVSDKSGVFVRLLAVKLLSEHPMCAKKVQSFPKQIRNMPTQATQNIDIC